MLRGRYCLPGGLGVPASGAGAGSAQITFTSGAAAPGPAAPAGATGILDLSGESVGAFPTVANGGSAGGDWTRNGSDIVIAADGPNGMNCAKKSASADFVKLGTKTVADLVAVGDGMIGFIGRLTLSGSSTFANGILNALLWDDSSGLTMLSSMESTEKLRPINRGGSLNQFVDSGGTYKTNTWRAGVVRWDGTANKIYIKLNGEASWAEGAQTQDIFSGAGTWRLLSSGSFTNALAKWMSYQSQSEENGDALLAHLTALAGL